MQTAGPAVLLRAVTSPEHPQSEAPPERQPEPTPAATDPGEPEVSRPELIRARPGGAFAGYDGVYSGIASRAEIPFVSYGVIALCVGIFLLINGAQGERAVLKLVFSPGNGLVWPGILTHMFAHSGAGHLLGNMLGVYFLGTTIERRYGNWSYGLLYLLSGLAAALAQAWVEPQGLLLGASGALAGVMAAFLRHYPHTRLYIYGVLPLPTWVFMPLWLLLNILGFRYGQSLSIAFMAHLAGFAAGLLLSLLIEPTRRRPAKLR